ncbi:type II secretion system F family protein [Patescibacteria group bacterium]
MPLFAYKAKDKKGKIVDDVIQATSKSEASSIVKSNDLQLLTLKNLESRLSKSIGGKVSVSDKASFCRFMATMLRAGMPLPEAIDIIRQETKNPKLRNILFDVSFQVRKGAALSAVLSNYEREFGIVFLTMVKAGEESGTLEKSFDHLSRQLLSAYELSQKVKGSMMYPIVIVGAMIANAVVMLVFVLPKLSDVFLSLNVELPTITRFVLTFGSNINENLAITLGFFFFSIAFFVALFYFRTTRDLIFSFFVKLPVIKNIANEIDVARFARTLATLLSSGVPITNALDVSSDVIAQNKMKKEAKKFSRGISEGESLSEILSKGKNIFPVTMVQTIKAGEKTGSLETVLDEMAAFYEMEIDYSLKRATALLEPLLMLVIGIAVGAMVIIMITPIYSIVGGLEGNI